MPFDIRPDQVGWTVFDVSTGRAVLLDDVLLVGLELADADTLVDLLNRQAMRRTSNTELAGSGPKL